MTNSPGLVDVSASGSERRKWAEQAMEELNPEGLFMDGMDEAIIGIGCQYSKNATVIYDEDLILRVLTEVEGLSFEDAWDHYSFNIAGAWVGENTPIIMVGLPNVEQWSMGGSLGLGVIEKGVVADYGEFKLEGAAGGAAEDTPEESNESY